MTEIPHEKSYEEAGSSRIGLQLFLIYTVFYAGFVLVNAFAPEWSEWTVIGGVNLAVAWGFSLIGLAFLLAIFYGAKRSGEERASEMGDRSSDGSVHGGVRAGGEESAQ